MLFCAVIRHAPDVIKFKFEFFIAPLLWAADIIIVFLVYDKDPGELDPTSVTPTYLLLNIFITSACPLCFAWLFDRRLQHHNSHEDQKVKFQNSLKHLTFRFYFSTP